MVKAEPAENTTGQSILNLPPSINIIQKSLSLKKANFWEAKTFGKQTLRKKFSL